MPRAYVARAFDVRRVTLRTGEQMIVTIATDSCLAVGQSTRIMIFEHISHGYRRVLDDVTLPGFAKVNEDGTAVLPTHESMEVIFEAAYVWNGTRYVFSPSRSHRYDVALGEQRPYELPVRFTAGTFAATLSGSVAYNFGDGYVFSARAGQGVTMELTKHTGDRARVSLYYGDGISSIGELNESDRWSGKLPRTGTYRLLVSGSDASSDERPSRYAIVLTIR
jgi:hypothetical protein